MTFRAKSRRTAKAVGVIAVAGIGVMSVTANPNVVAAADAPPTLARLLPPAAPRSVSVKFAGAEATRVFNGALASTEVSVNEAPNASAKERLAIRDRSSPLRAFLAANSARVRRQFIDRTEDDFTLERQQLERATGEKLLDKNSFLIVDVPPGMETATFVSMLRRIDGVEYAEPVPVPVPLPAPNFSSVLFQGYRYGAPANGSAVAGGIGATTSPSIARGATGSNVKIVDLEYSWNTAHEDLTKAANALIPMGTPADPFNDNNHGTGVLGILIGDDNASGVTGLAPDATIGMVNTFSTAGYNLPAAISLAQSNLSPGDVILIEQQYSGPLGSTDYVPVEWNFAAYTAIQSAVAAGIIVVEAAGNGAQNLDDAAAFGSPFPSGRSDSGAIIVGAGGVGGSGPNCPFAVPRSRLSFSTYGARVNLQGWGECVTTTGYGSMFNGGFNARYTSSFNGTSSASPIVAAAAAILSSVAKEQGITLTPRQVRQALVDTATPGVSGGKIGGLPNVEAAVKIYFAPTALLSAPTTASPGQTISLSGVGSTDPQGDPLLFGWDFNNDGDYSDASGPEPTFRLPYLETTRRINIRVADAHGAVGFASADVIVAFPPRTGAPQVSAPSTTVDRPGAPQAPGLPGGNGRGPAPQV